MTFQKQKVRRTFKSICIIEDNKRRKTMGDRKRLEGRTTKCDVRGWIKFEGEERAVVDRQVELQ